MYGVIYIAIQDYAEATIGTEKWQAILATGGFDINFTNSEQAYNDDIAYALAVAIAQASAKPLTEVLFSMGLQVIRTTNAKFKPIISSRGETLHDYLINLPNFHNRISLIYPDLNAPEFRMSDVTPHSMVFHYRKKRDGMTEYFRGYISGLAEVFNEQVTITPIPGAATEEVYKITW